jgi:RRXRR protein
MPVQTRHQPRKGASLEAERTSMSVFVLDQQKHPLMPCSEKRARVLLSRQRAVVHRVVPFTIRLKDRRVGECHLQPVALKLDPGSKTTGVALARVEQTEQGEVHHAAHLAELSHQGEKVHQALQQRSRYRRRRRSSNLRYRQPRFLNRRRSPGWLPPSLRSRIGNILTWTRRYCHLVPISRIEVEQVKFDMQLMQDPEVAGVEYQRGELSGWEIRAYLMDQKRVRGFATGDLVRAVVPAHLKTAGVHTARVVVRAKGSFRVGKVDGIHARYCHLLQRGDGYAYTLKGK